MKPLIVRSNCLQKDSWTSGDYVQYIAFVDDDTTVICRRSSMPLIFGALGFAMLVAVGLLVFNSPSDLIDWWGAFAVTIFSFMLMGPLILEFITPWRWMVQLRPPLEKRFDESGNVYWYRTYLDD